jgi:hypothetical protein
VKFCALSEILHGYITVQHSSTKWRGESTKSVEERQQRNPDLAAKNW